MAVSSAARPEDTDAGRRYFAQLPQFAERLAARVAAEHGETSPDAIAELPSTRNFNKPYTAALLTRYPNAMDLSATILRANLVKSGETDSFEAVLEDTQVVVRADLSTIRCLVLVDDILAEGKTVGATIVRFREVGLPTTARIVVATPLVVFAPRRDGGP